MTEEKTKVRKQRLIRMSAPKMHAVKAFNPHKPLTPENTRLSDYEREKLVKRIAETHLIAAGLTLYHAEGENLHGDILVRSPDDKFFRVGTRFGTLKKGRDNRQGLQNQWYIYVKKGRGRKPKRKARLLPDVKIKDHVDVIALVAPKTQLGGEMLNCYVWFIPASDLPEGQKSFFALKDTLDERYVCFPYNSFYSYDEEKGKTKWFLLQAKYLNAYVGYTNPEQDAKEFEIV